MAMAAMIKMIATTISNSIREKPFCFFMMRDLLGKSYGARAHSTSSRRYAKVNERDYVPAFQQLTSPAANPDLKNTLVV
jgi:hypothetical protein